MNTEEQFSEEIKAAIENVLRQANSGTITNLEVSEDREAVSVYGQEEVFLDRQKSEEQLKDIRSARSQREKYARNVFFLVAGWIGGMFIILLAQGFYPSWHSFSDAVLISLITSMTINLIGTLVIVLKYIFR